MDAETHLNFKFRGSRNYIHGPDIYRAVSSILPPDVKSSASSVLLSCNTLMDKNAVAYLEWNCDETADSVFTVKSNKEGVDPFVVYISEASEIPTERVPYDEDFATSGWQYSEEEGTATLNKPNQEYTILQTIVALNKVYLSRLNDYPEGKWIFARVRLNDFFPETCESVKLISKPTRSLRLVRSKIEVDGQAFGEIYFSLT